MRNADTWTPAPPDPDLVLHPVMNHTKWEELRLAMYAMDRPPTWSTLDKNGYQAPPDGDWFYHFRADGHYDTIIHVDVFPRDAEHRGEVLHALKAVHVPGEEIAEGFRIFGYLRHGQSADFL